MLSTIIEKLMRPQPPPWSADEAALLASSSLPDPADLQRRLAALTVQRDADEARCEQIQHDGRAVLELVAIGERRGRLEAQIDAQKSQIAAVEKRRAALVAVVEIRDATHQQITQVEQRLYADLLILPKDERRARLELLDGLVRLRARLDAALAVVSPLRKFRRAADPFAALTHDLRARAEEIERTLGPGMPRAPIAWPTGAQDLLDALKGGTA